MNYDSMESVLTSKALRMLYYCRTKLMSETKLFKVHFDELVYSDEQAIDGKSNNRQCRCLQFCNVKYNEMLVGKNIHGSKVITLHINIKGMVDSFT
ncbi:Uncharacterized protein TCM_014840 [Theobroma cacao]|uniref:Uncharacterized protein n=1 Tax=Theobroma cacao TaxID=3641 RepID=A0A061G079_THECC|nr:Uncharacterized protein TCM_014840 [Theobroma cacao]